MFPLKSWMRFDAETPLAERVVLRRHSTDTGDVITTNVPWLVVSGSPDGYEWGYGGSGPSDLALNILENVLPLLGYPTEPRVKCHRGDCSALAWYLHNEFKWRFLAPLDKAGGDITIDQIKAWLNEEDQQRIVAQQADESAFMQHLLATGRVGPEDLDG